MKRDMYFVFILVELCLRCSKQNTLKYVNNFAEAYHRKTFILQT